MMSSIKELAPRNDLRAGISYAARLANVVRGMAGRGQLALRERWPREQLLELQRRRIAALLTHAAARSTFWRERLAGVPLGAGDLSLVPPITKGELMERFDDAVTVPALRHEEILAHLVKVGDTDILFRGRYRVLSSGGSSGRPGTFVYGPRDWNAFLGGVFRWTKLMGLGPRLPRMRVATVSAPDARHMTFRGATSIDVGVFRPLRMSATEPLDSLVDRLNHFQPNFLFAYASIAALLAEEQQAGRLRICLEGLCTTSELRTPDMNMRIHEAFGVNAFDCYATTETGIAAVDCDLHSGLHLFEDLSVVEVVDREGRTVADGELGHELLVTNLNNLTQPMIRVRVDDQVRVTSDACPCGRTLRRIVELGGRADDVLELPGVSGPVEIHPIHFRSPLGTLKGMAEYQLVQRPGRLELRVVASTGANASEVAARARSRVVQALARAGVVDTLVVAQPVERLERQTSAAKLKLVEKYIPPF